MREYAVTKNDAGKRADRFLGKAAPDLPLSAVQKAFRKKDVKRNGKPCKADERLAEGDTVRAYGIGEGVFIKDDTLRVPPLSPEHIIYSDPHLLVVRKPPGIPSQSVSDEPGIEDLCRAYLRDTGEWDPENENGFLPSLCHRLDRNTEGLLLFAKTAPALRALSEMIRRREVVKTYRCAVAGVPSPKSGEWRDWLWKDASQKRVYARNGPSPGAKEAVLRYKVLRSSNGKSLLEVEPVTGRTHQIRVQCASRGHPISGDGKYGRARKGERLALCAVRLELRLGADAGELAYLGGKIFQTDGKFDGFD